MSLEERLDRLESLLKACEKLPKLNSNLLIVDESVKSALRQEWNA